MSPTMAMPPAVDTTPVRYAARCVWLHTSCIVLHVVRRQLAEMVVGVGHRQEPPHRTVATLLRLANGEVHARLAQRHDQHARGLVIAHGAPVLAAGGAWAHVHRLVELHLENVRPIARTPCFGIDALPDRLLHHLLVAEELARAPIELPQHARFARAERHLLRADVHENPLEDFIEIEGLSGRVLEVPRQLSGVGVQRQCGGRVERLVEWCRPSIEKLPGLRLRGPPIRQIQIGIVGARDPGLDAGPRLLRKLAPRVVARFALARDGVEPPRALPRVDVDGADVAAVSVSGTAPASR